MRYVTKKGIYLLSITDCNTHVEQQGIQFTRKISVSDIIWSVAAYEREVREKLGEIIATRS